MTVTTHMQLCSEQEWARLSEHLHLPPRQAEIAKHIMSGKSDKQIARAMGISITTVRTHVSRVFRKFDLNDRAELMLHVFACLRQSDVGHEHCDSDPLP
jgi:DNA-binding CsgD family transcriptional regulator